MKKKTVRVSFDVPIDEHTFLKSTCVEAHITFRNLMRKVFHKTVEQFKKEKLHDLLKEGIREAKDGKTSRLTKKDLAKWNKMIDDV